MNALQGIGDIAAWIETLWREQAHRRGIKVSHRTVRRYLHRDHDPLPAQRLGDVGSVWIADRDEVTAWWRRNLISTGMAAPAPIAR